MAGQEILEIGLGLIKFLGALSLPFLPQIAVIVIACQRFSPVSLGNVCEQYALRSAIRHHVMYVHEKI